MRRLLLAGSFLAGAGVFASSMAVHFRTPLLPAIGDDLAMSAAALGYITTLFGAGRLALDFPAGYMVDRLGPHWLFALTGLLIIAGSIAFGSAPAPAWVLSAAVVLGAASAMANTGGMTYFSTHATAASRGRAMGGYSAALLSGQAIGPALAGGLASIGTWRTAMGWAAAIGAVMFLGAVLLIAAGRGGRTPNPGPAGRHRPPPATGGREDAAGGSLARGERWALYSVSFSMMFTLGAMPQTLVPIIGGQPLGLSVGTIGLALGVGGIGRLVGALLGGHLSDRYPRKAVLLPSLVGFAGGVALLAAPGSVLLWYASIMVMSVASFGIGPAAAMLGDRVERSRAGREVGAFRFVGDMGLLVGPTLAAQLLATAGQTVAVLMVAALLLASTAATALLVPTRR